MLCFTSPTLEMTALRWSHSNKRIIYPPRLSFPSSFCHHPPPPSWSVLVVFVPLLSAHKAISPGNKSSSECLLWKLASLIKSNGSRTQGGWKEKVSRLRTFNEYWIHQQNHSPSFTHAHKHKNAHTEPDVSIKRNSPIGGSIKIPKRNNNISKEMNTICGIGQVRLVKYLNMFLYCSWSLIIDLLRDHERSNCLFVLLCLLPIRGHDHFFFCSVHLQNILAWNS